MLKAVRNSVVIFHVATQPCYVPRQQNILPSGSTASHSEFPSFVYYSFETARTNMTDITPRFRLALPIDGTRAEVKASQAYTLPLRHSSRPSRSCLSRDTLAMLYQQHFCKSNNSVSHHLIVSHRNMLLFPIPL